MINLIRSVAKKSNLLVKLYISYSFLKQVPFRDFINTRKLRLFLKVRPYTMQNYSGLSNTYELARIAERHNIEGCFVECGVWRGGTAAVMAYISDKARNNRKVYLFDSFEGLPEPTEQDGEIAPKLYAEYRRGEPNWISNCVGPYNAYDDVIYLLFSLLKLKRENIIIHKGWLQDTIPQIKNTIGSIAILRLDGDWYESTKVPLDNLYDSVSSGGFVIIDDYNCPSPGCRHAVDEFLANRKIQVKLVTVTPQAIVYFQKP